MSWQTKVNSDYIIRTGDGQDYRPLWKLSNKSVEYNVSLFEFSEVQGTLVDRRLPKGRKIPLLIMFQGDDCIDVANRFEDSAKDPRAWQITHPYFGLVIVQPLSLEFDFSTFNVAIISGDLIETITTENPSVNISATGFIEEQKEITDEAFNTQLSSVSDTITSPQKNKSKANFLKLYTEGLKSVQDKVDSETYFNLFKEANNAINTITIQPLESIRTISVFISYPIQFKQNVQSRINLYATQINTLNLTIGSVLNPTDKSIFQNQLGNLISSMCLTASLPQQNDYKNRVDVINVINQIIISYTLYLNSLDLLQTSTGRYKDSFIPDSNSLIKLSTLVNFTISNLFIIALSSKQERSLILTDDSNAILLTHRFYGLDENDENLTYFMDTNNIGINELLILEKGRKILYYI